MRDEFTDAVKKAVAARVGYRCSNPSCRALTTGPQDDPAKAINVGVAAHITAALSGGPRYDSALLPGERKRPSNAIWLCQNCAKKVDNDPGQFPPELLRRWKEDAEREARERVGKTAIQHEKPRPQFSPGARLRIRPVIPNHAEQDMFVVESEESDFVDVLKANSSAHVRIPKTFIRTTHRFGDKAPVLVQLNGRLQWITLRQCWDLFPEEPPLGPEGSHGLSKPVGFDYATRPEIQPRFKVRWFREDKVHNALGRGWYVFYDGDGRYLRVPGPDVDQILLSQQP